MVDLKLNSYKNEKFEFRKNFVTMLLSVESFCPHDFRKIAQRNFKLRGGNFPEKWIILKKKIFFHRNQREIVIVCHSFAKVFDLRFKN